MKHTDIPSISSPPSKVGTVTTHIIAVNGYATDGYVINGCKFFCRTKF